MNFRTLGKEGAPELMLIPGLGVSWEIFRPLIDLLFDRYRIIAVEVDGFTPGVHTEFTSVEDQAVQVSRYISTRHGGRICCAYGLSLGGKILSKVLERNEVTIEHSILDAAPLLPLPKWLIGPLRNMQAGNVWSCITGQVSGIGFSTHIISMCCSTNAGRHILSEGSRQYWTAIDRSIRTGSNLSRKQIFITGMGPRRPLWLNIR